MSENLSDCCLGRGNWIGRVNLTDFPMELPLFGKKRKDIKERMVWGRGESQWIAEKENSNENRERDKKKETNEEGEKRHMQTCCL